MNDLPKAMLGVSTLASIFFFAANLPVFSGGLSLGNDMNLGTWSPYASRYQIHRRVCAWSSTPDQYYRVIAGTKTNSEHFELLGDLGDRVRYEVRWRHDDTSMTWERLIPGLPSSRRYPLASKTNCPGEKTGLQVRLSKADADAVPGGRYSGILTITLVAE